MNSSDLIFELDKEFEICDKRYNHWLNEKNIEMARFFDGRKFQIRQTLELLKQLNEEPVKRSEVCDSCTDKNGQNIGNMYICPKCGRSVD